jgi:hypothetical protein
MLSADNTFPWERNLQLTYQGVTSAVDATGTPQEPSRPIAVAVFRYETTRQLFELSSVDIDGLLTTHRDRQLPSMVLPVEAAIRIRSRHTALSGPNVGALVRASDSRLKDEFVLYTSRLDHSGSRQQVRLVDWGLTFLNCRYPRSATKDHSSCAACPRCGHWLRRTLGDRAWMAPGSPV